MRKKTLSTVLAVTVLMSLLAGCGNGGKTETAVEGTTAGETSAEKQTEAAKKKEGSIEFMSGTSIDSALYKEYQVMVDQFAEENPDAPEIELVPSSTDHEGEIKTRLGGGNIPDMWMTHGWSLGRYSEYLLDLQNEPWAADLNPLLQDVMVGENNEIYALPLNVDIAGILYNGDVLEEAGYKPEDITTWDTFISCCEAIKSNGKVPIYNSGKSRWTTGLYVDWIAPSYFTQEECDTVKNGTFVEDKYRAVLNLVQTFKEKEFFNPDYSSATTDDTSRALAQGETGFAFVMNAELVTAFEYAPEADLGFMQIPNVEGQKPYYVCGEKDAIGIAKDGKHVDTCIKFLEFLSKPENIAVLATATGQQTGLTSAASELGALDKSFEATAKYPGVPYFDRVYMPSGAWDAIVATTEMVVTGEKDVDGAMAQIEKEYHSLIGQ